MPGELEMLHDQLRSVVFFSGQLLQSAEQIRSFSGKGKERSRLIEQIENELRGLLGAWDGAQSRIASLGAEQIERWERAQVGWRDTLLSALSEIEKPFRRTRPLAVEGWISNSRPNRIRIEPILESGFVESLLSLEEYRGIVAKIVDRLAAILEAEKSSIV